MTELLTAAQMRAIEQAAIDSGQVTGLELMERAGRGVVEAIFEEWPELRGRPEDRGASPSSSPPYLEKDEGVRRAVVLCGPGNNGGDGFVVARLLRTRGWDVEVFLYGDPKKLPPDARVNYERCIDQHLVTTLSETNWNALSRAWNGCDVFIEAAFGTGLTRGLTTGIVSEFEFMNAYPRHARKERQVSVDLPAGHCANSGKPLGGRFFADLTVTFHSLKLGHYQGDGPLGSGKVIVKDIGLRGGPHPPSTPVRSHAPTQSQDDRLVRLLAKAQRNEQTIVRSVKPTILRKHHSQHKYTHGHALILSGPMGRSGAARLAARGALRIGAGLVTVAAPGSAMMECATQLTAIMLRKCDGSEGLAALLEDDRLNAVCLGPGLGVSDETRDLVAAALKDKGSSQARHPARGVVLDADALASFADDPDALFARTHDRTILTPHAGEFARLFPDIAEKLSAPATTGPAYSKVDATREAASRAGCTVLFKGPDTVIADQTDRCAINAAVYDRAAPWLATAGSGDVLAGFITGLLARGLSPMQAAETGAWLHLEAARAFGPGLIAEDLPEALPGVLSKLLEPSD